MAIVEVKVPQLSESVAEATMLQWKKKVGEAIAVDEILIEIETDKAMSEVESIATGVLKEVRAWPDDLVAAGQVIAVFEVAGTSPGVTQTQVPSPAPELSAPIPAPVPASFAVSEGAVARSFQSAELLFATMLMSE